MATHHMQRLSRWAYYCEEHGVTVVVHSSSPPEFPPRHQSDTRGSPLRSPGGGAGRRPTPDPVYITSGKGERYHEVDSCHILGRSNTGPEVFVVSRSRAQRDGRTPCLACSKKP
jgi:hypothetical protein